MAAALHLSGCGEDVSDAERRAAQPPAEETVRQAEKASDAGKPLSDASLTQIIRSALESESSLDPRKIDVENRSGNVTLRGTVASDEQREKAGRIVAAVGGVREVQNELTVDTSAATGATAGAGAPILQRKD
jgi:hyperosmotically inducible protein